MFDYTLDRKLRRMTHTERGLNEGRISKEKFQNDFFIEAIDKHMLDYGKFATDNTMVIFDRHPRFVELPMHSHNYIELVYVYSGSVRHIFSDEEVTLREGQIMVLNKYASHRVAECGEGDIAINLMINPIFFERLLLPTKGISNGSVLEFIYSSEIEKKNISNFLLFDSLDVNNVKNIISNIVFEHYEDSMVKNTAIQLNVNLLFLEMIKNQEKIELKRTVNGHDPDLIKIYDYLNKNYKSANLQELAKELGISESHLSRKIKKIFNANFSNLLTDTRLKKAERQLQTTNVAIEEIVASVGCSNLTYFYSKFKDKHSMTPNDYRKLNKHVE